LNPPFQLTGNPWLDLAMASLAAIACALIVHGIGAAMLARALRSHEIGGIVLRYTREPARWVLIFAALGIVLQGAAPALPSIGNIRHGAGLAFIAAFLNAVFGLCLGCELYLVLQRIGLVGRERTATA